MKGKEISRRKFIGGLATSAAGVMIVPRHVLGGPGFRAPSDTVNVAAIGAGGMGASNMEELTSQNIVAICDVDWARVKDSIDGRLTDRSGQARPNGVLLKQAYDKAKRYEDFRVMFDRQRDIDAVVIATPDHFHAVAANHAMKLGKHVYVQKPLTWSVYEARVLRDTAAETGVVTQMGNQGHSHDDGRRLVEWVWADAIGPVHEVHIWTNRPVWPQGIPRPDQTPEATNGTNGREMNWNHRGIMELFADAMGGRYPVPETMNWDIWLGPASYVDYHPIYAPFNWRGWVDYGTGALGDMGAHLVDHTYWALGLDYPTRIWATSTPFGGVEERASWPQSVLVNYEFARGGREPVKVTWYDGGLLPPRHEWLPLDVELNRGGGAMMVGEKGILLYDTYGHNPRMYPESLMQEYADAPQVLPRIPVSHEMNWINAIQGQAEATSPFSYAAPLTETMLLGMIAVQAGKPLVYDAENMRFLNAPEADALLHREYRQGWSL